MFTISNFESATPKKILERGQDYFDSGAVYELEELEPGIWQAAVEGHGALLEHEAKGLLDIITHYAQSFVLPTQLPPIVHNYPNAQCENLHPGRLWQKRWAF